MKTKNSILFYPLMMMGALLMFMSSCTKDEPIIKKDVVITWSNPVDITSGTLISTTQLNATVDVPGTFVYTPAMGTKLNEGANQDLKVDFTPTDVVNYNIASKTVKINVIAKKNPIITWVNPADITYGSLLSATQLNATSDVPGTFVYTPAMGTKLNEGTNQDLKVDFTPADATNYNTATKTVKINITAATTVTDYDGNIYHTVVIGTQTWLVENLRTTKYNDGTAITNVTDNTAWLTAGAAYCWYNNDANNYKATYGALYNWYAVDKASNGNKNICPTGWHVPADAEWTTLITYLGGETVAGGKMKESGTTHWNSPNTGADNSSGFSALPAGCRNYGVGSFVAVGMLANFWSSTPNGRMDSWRRCLDNGYGGVFNNDLNRTLGSSIRCTKD